jgi:hypothetical protein
MQLMQLSNDELEFIMNVLSHCISDLQTAELNEDYFEETGSIEAAEEALKTIEDYLSTVFIDTYTTG